MFPFRAIIPELDEDENDTVIRWGEMNEGIVHDYAIKAAVELMADESEDLIVIVEFFTCKTDIIPFADIIVERDEIETVFDDAESYYVRVEEYEKAAEVKTIRERLNIKSKLYGK